MRTRYAQQLHRSRINETLWPLRWKGSKPLAFQQPSLKLLPLTSTTMSSDHQQHSSSSEQKGPSNATQNSEVNIKTDQERLERKAEKKRRQLLQQKAAMERELSNPFAIAIYDDLDQLKVRFDEIDRVGQYVKNEVHMINDHVCGQFRPGTKVTGAHMMACKDRCTTQNGAKRRIMLADDLQHPENVEIRKFWDKHVLCLPVEGYTQFAKMVDEMPRGNVRHAVTKLRLTRNDATQEPGRRMSDKDIVYWQLGRFPRMENLDLPFDMCEFAFDGALLRTKALHTRNIRPTYTWTLPSGETARARWFVISQSVGVHPWPPRELHPGRVCKSCRYEFICGLLFFGMPDGDRERLQKSLPYVLEAQRKNLEKPTRPQWLEISWPRPRFLPSLLQVSVFNPGISDKPKEVIWREGQAANKAGEAAEKEDGAPVELAPTATSIQGRSREGYRPLPKERQKQQHRRTKRQQKTPEPS